MDDYLQDLPALLFWILATLTGLCAVAVVVSQNIVRSATWLLFTLGGVSAIFFLLGADFVGATQLLVYVGGTLVLVIFGVMLTAQGPFVTMKATAAEWAISAVVGLLLMSVLVVSILAVNRPAPRGPAEDYAPATWLNAEPAATANPALAARAPVKRDDPAATAKSADVIGVGFIGVGVGPTHHANSAAGQAVRMNYLLPFEIVSVHLLVVLIGAAYLARAKRHRRAKA
jgi:NADH-quinone oxidoreductase subunit J